jgi:hypothetical protein
MDFTDSMPEEFREEFMRRMEERETNCEAHRERCAEIVAQDLSRDRFIKDVQHKMDKASRLQDRQDCFNKRDLYTTKVAEKKIRARELRVQALIDSQEVKGL